MTTDAGQAAETPFANRLRKRARHLSRWAKQRGLTAYRLYDRDLPEYPYVVDWYDGRAHVIEYARPRETGTEKAEARSREVVAAVERVLEVAPGRVYLKAHRKHVWGREQYGRVAQGSERFVVQEGELRFWVNLGDYLDTGLFLDDRPWREELRTRAQQKRVLNLFSYTGGFTVSAAAGGAAATTSVDLSNTYCEWARDNLVLNGLAGPRHELLRADVLAWLPLAVRRRERFELIIVAPPSFSSSKRMARTLDVQRDHVRLVRDAAALLSPGGQLLFTTNYRGFNLDATGLEPLTVEERTRATEDFARPAHRAFWITSAH